jgi:hypothetical protein
MLSIAFSCPHIPSCALQTAREHMIAIVASLEICETIRHWGNLVNSHFFMPASRIEEKAVRNLAVREMKGGEGRWLSRRDKRERYRQFGGGLFPKTCFKFVHR